MKKIKLNLTMLAGLILGLSIIVTGCEDDMNLSDTNSDNYTLDNRGFNPDDVTGQNANSNQNSDICGCLNDAFEKETLSENEKVAILFMREEEKLARDVYAFLYEEWNQKIFENIARSESRHMDAIGCLIERYDLDDPVQEDIEGVFKDPNLSDLYVALTEKGTLSLGDALNVGATIEDLDISDLLAHLEDEDIDNEDIRAVFGELLKGSRNHMRAFVRNLKNQSLSYSPEYITDEYYEEIINAEREKGGSICEGLNECQGHGKGSNAGNGDCDGSGQQNQNGNQDNDNGAGSGNDGNQNGNGNNGGAGGNGNNGGNGNSGGNGGN